MCTRLGIISQDPIGFAAGDANLYRYVGNGPTNAIDPSGLETIWLPLPHRPTNRERFNEIYQDQVKYGYPDKFVDIMVHAYDANVEAARREEYFRRESRKFNQRMLVGASFAAPAAIAAAYAGPAAISAARVGYTVLSPYLGSSGAFAAELANPAPVALAGGAATVASRAWAQRKQLTGSARELGTRQHKHARDVLDRYQQMFGDRGLITERSFINGLEVPYGSKGSTRLDVLDTITGDVWDYKFGVTPMSQGQINRIFQHGPGINSVTPLYK